MTNPMKILVAGPALVFLTAASIQAIGSRQSADLRAQALQAFGTLPAAMASEKNPITPAKVRLGKMLFYESRISADGSVSCAKCHPFSLYGADGLKKSIGNGGKTTPRNAPTVLNAAGQIAAHWSGNRKDVEDQARQSVLGPASFGMPSNEAVVAVLNGLKGYAALFKEAFPGPADPLTIDNFALAVGAFERTLVTPAPLDAFLRGDAAALDERQKSGLKIFLDMTCSDCHSGPYVGGALYQKFGTVEPYWKSTGSDPIDDGRFADTKNEADRYVFKVPPLRNAAKTAPYFHDGSVPGVGDAVRIMARVELGQDLTPAQIQDVVSFLRALTGRIPADALTWPVLPARD